LYLPNAKCLASFFRGDMEAVTEFRDVTWPRPHPLLRTFSSGSQRPKDVVSRCQNFMNIDLAFFLGGTGIRGLVRGMATLPKVTRSY